MEIKTCEQYVLDQLEQVRAERDWLRGKLEQAQDEAEELRGKLMERGERDASKVEQAIRKEGRRKLYRDGTGYHQRAGRNRAGVRGAKRRHPFRDRLKVRHDLSGSRRQERHLKPESDLSRHAPGCFLGRSWYPNEDNRADCAHLGSRRCANGAPFAFCTNPLGVESGGFVVFDVVVQRHEHLVVERAHLPNESLDQDAGAERGVRQDKFTRQTKALIRVASSRLAPLRF